MTDRSNSPKNNKFGSVLSKSKILDFVPSKAERDGSKSDLLTNSNLLPNSMSALKVEGTKSSKLVLEQKVSKPAEKEVRRFQFGKAPRKRAFIVDKGSITGDKSPSVKSRVISSFKEDSLTNVQSTISKQSLHDINNIPAGSKDYLSEKHKTIEILENQDRFRKASSSNATSPGAEKSAPLLKVSSSNPKFSFMDILRTTPQDTTLTRTPSSDLNFYNDMKKVILSITNNGSSPTPKINVVGLKPLSIQTKLPIPVIEAPALSVIDVRSASSITSLNSRIKIFENKTARGNRDLSPEFKKLERGALTDRQASRQIDRSPMIFQTDKLDELKVVPIAPSSTTSICLPLPRIIHQNEIVSPSRIPPKKSKPKNNGPDANAKKSTIFALENLADAPFSLNSNNPIVKLIEENKNSKKSLSEKNKGLSVIKKGTQEYSKAVLVKYFDQFETKIIQPEFMQKIGSMCVTELWSQNNKRVYLQQMRGGISVYRNRHRDGENFESLFQPDKRHNQLKIDDHVNLNSLGVDDTRQKEINPNSLTVETKALLKYRDSQELASAGIKAPVDVKSARDKPSPFLKASRATTTISQQEDGYMHGLYKSVVQETSPKNSNNPLSSTKRDRGHERIKELTILGKSRRF